MYNYYDCLLCFTGTLLSDGRREAHSNHHDELAITLYVSIVIDAPHLALQADSSVSRSPSCDPPAVTDSTFYPGTAVIETLQGNQTVVCI